MTGKHVFIISIGFIAIILFMIPSTTWAGLVIFGIMAGSAFSNQISVVVNRSGEWLDKMIKERGRK